MPSDYPLFINGRLEYPQVKHVHVDVTRQRARHRWFDVTVPRRQPNEAGASAPERG